MNNSTLMMEKLEVNTVALASLVSEFEEIVNVLRQAELRLDKPDVRYAVLSTFTDDAPAALERMHKRSHELAVRCNAARMVLSRLQFKLKRGA